MFCKKCGKELGERSEEKFCTQCGEIITMTDIEEGLDKNINTVPNINKISKHSRKKRVPLIIGLSVIIFVALFFALDKGTVFRLIRNPNVKKVIWVPCWEVSAENGTVSTTCHGFADILFGSRIYGTDGTRIEKTGVDWETGMPVNFDKKKHTFTWYSVDGKEEGKINLDGVSEISQYALKKGFIGVEYKSGNSGWLNLYTKQLYDTVGDISDGYMVVQKNSLYGYIDINGNERIAPQYEDAGMFKNGWAKVMKNDGSRVFIDKNGTEVFGGKLAGSCSDDSTYNDTLIRMKDGIVNRDGGYILKSDNSEIKILNNSLIMVEGENEIYFLDSSGREKYRCMKILDDGYQYDSCQKKNNGLIVLRYMDDASPRNSLYIILSQTGELITKSITSELYYDYTKMKMNAIFWFENGELLGIVDKRTVIHTGIMANNNHIHISEMNDVTIIETDTGVYFMNQSGEIVDKLGSEYYIPNGAGQSYGGLCVIANKNNKNVIYDFKNKEMKSSQYRDIGLGSSKLLILQKNRPWGYVVILK